LLGECRNIINPLKNEERRMEEGTIFMKHVKKKNLQLVGSQAVPTCPSGVGRLEERLALG
jgi:hypothetical protein